MEPLISLTICGQRRTFFPGDELVYQFQVDAVGPTDLQAVETSVLWHTDGRGDEDLGVHHFQRFTPEDVEGGDLRQMQTVRTTLPNSPLSYDGPLVKIRWCVRVRVFLRGGKEAFLERPFRLGDVPSPSRIAARDLRHDSPTRAADTSTTDDDLVQ